MTWSDDGTRWRVDDRPWIDEFRWDEVLRRADHLRGQRAARRPGEQYTACQTCYDEDWMISRDEEGRWFSLPCPTCQPERYRAWVDDAERGRRNG